MTPHRLLPFILLIVAAGCSGDAAGPSLPSHAKSTVAVPAPAMDEIPAMPDDPGCSHLGATLYGAHEAGTGWVGNTLVSFNGAAPESATFLDKGSWHDKKFLAEITTGSLFRGKETLKLGFADGDTLVENAQYAAVPASTPYLYEIHENGTLSGTGRFANASGHVVVTGPFLNPLYVETPPWTAAMTGWICM